MIAQTILFVLVSLVLGAHFLRQGNLLVMLLCILAPFLLLYRKRWVLVALQIFTYVAAIVWVYTAMELVNQRILAGERFRGVIVILGSVALVTVATGLLMNLRGIKERFPG